MKKFFLIITTMLCMVNMQAQTITMASYNIRYNNPDDAEEGMPGSNVVHIFVKLSIMKSRYS